MTLTTDFTYEEGVTIVQDFIDQIYANEDTQQGSLIIKSNDINGCTLKWLHKTNGTATRDELFIHTCDLCFNVSVEKRKIKSYIMLDEAR